MSDAPVIVARIARPHGIRGGLLLEAETDHAEALFQAGRRLQIIGAPPPRALTVETARLHGGRWLVEVREVADRTVAEGLRGARLAVPRAELPDLPDGGYLLHDLIGMSVCEEDTTIGVIREVYDQPGAPLLALDVDGRERLIPFDAELVVELDFEAGEVHMKLPAGLLDI
ncbi:ribosome maturation factor RimM [Candidatus Palauibacter soopunensis]|uniref:ribosome maturation factor RimM n=1 Tax=Candidatus Palauibacter soopunensis TaxID=3056739 RepID=UPI002388F46F|nr:ribosome maturation factor RimM [Candidatus Palauibacter soopunensis]MDE2878671.1 ribosome maturation factor RimM [Candidatus Palauibacter soopunensis]